MNETEVTVVTSEFNGVRLDRYLSEQFPKESRSYFQKLVKQGLVLVNGTQVKKGGKLHEGDEVEIQFALTPEISLEPEDIPLDVIYEDDWLLAVNKPAGLVVHPGVGNWSGTFVNGLLHYCRHLPVGSEPIRPGIVHRLDKDTTGVLLAAKTEKAQARLVEMFAERNVYKEYLAVCVGDVGRCTIATPIGRHPKDRKKFAPVDAGGKDAITVCETVKFDGNVAVVRIELKTGRTHQIRVHLLSVGHPILGDQVYGNESWNKKYRATRQLLHANKVVFNHPITGDLVSIEAPIPEDMRKYT